MPTRQVSFGQEGFEAGVFHDTADYLIPDRGLRDLTDAFVEKDGAAIERGGTEYLSGAALDTSLRWVADHYFDVGQRTIFASADNFGVLDADDSTVINLGSDGLTHPATSALIPDEAGGPLLFIGGGYIYAGSRKAAPYNTGTISTTQGSTTVTGAGTTWNTLVDAGMLLQVGNERVYRVASITDTTTLELAEPYEGSTGAGKVYTLHNLYKITTADPYPDADFYGVCVNRLIWAERNLIHAAEQQQPHQLTAPIGGEDIPLTHALPEGVRITGFGTVGQSLLAFTTQGIWKLDGLAFDIVDTSGANQHTLSRYSGEHILWHANGIASWEDALVVPCVDGIFLIDGVSEPLRISHPVDEDVMTYVDRIYRCGQAVVYRGHYLLPVYSGSSSARAKMVCRINRPIRIQGQTVHPWSFFERHAKQVVAYAVRVGETTREPKLIGAVLSSDARLVECNYFDPGIDHEQDANGDIPTLDLISRAYATGNNTRNMVRNGRTRYELVSDDPGIEFSYATTRARAGVLLYDTGLLYDDGHQYVTDEEAGGFVAACTGGESDGREPKRCRVNTMTRFVIWRVRNPRASQSCRIRGIDIRVRPSQAVRR